MGHGKVEYDVWTLAGNIDSDVATSACIRVKGAEKELLGTNRYSKKIEGATAQIEEIAEERKKLRYEELIGEATERVEEAQAELDREKAKAEEKIRDAEKELEQAENEINKAEKELKEQTDTAQTKFQKAEEEWQTQEKQYHYKKEEAEKEFTKAEEQREELKAQKETLQKQLVVLQEAESNADIGTKPVIQAQIAQIQLGIEKLEGGMQDIDTAIQTGKQELASGRKQLDNAKQTLETEKKKAQNEIEKGKQKIAEAKQEIQNGRKELEENRKEFETTIAEAQDKLEEAREKIQEIKYPKWYIQDREEVLQGYNELVQEAESIDNISRVFPIIFFAVSTLMSLTSMTRMIDEERTQIGTLKALGYGKIKIAQKYIFYATEATVVGNLLGIGVGFYILLPIIVSACLTGYSVPDATILLDWKIAVVGFCLSIVCIVGGAIYTISRRLKDAPAELMRPEAPKPGKRVLLEKVPWLWKHFSFIQKVTLRNTFRYKKRFLMAIIRYLWSY